MWKKCVIALLSLSTYARGQEMKVYERGVIVNIQEDTSRSFYQGTSITEYFEDYWVRVGDLVYKGWCRDRLLHGCNIGFTIGEGVDVRFDKSSMFLKRSNGKEQKTTIEKRIEVNSQTDDALSGATAGLPHTSQPTSAASGIEQQSNGRITITSVPANAEIAVDKQFVGNSPATVKLAAGKHTITVTSKGFSTWTRDLTVLADSDLTVNAELEQPASGESSTVAPEQPDSVTQQAAQSADFSANFPKLWGFPNSNTLVNIEIRGDEITETEDGHNKSGQRITENCDVRKTGARWAGKCTLKLYKGEESVCSVELDEVITSVSPVQITGESQELLPPKKGEVCPTPAKSMVEFVSVPKN